MHNELCRRVWLSPSYERRQMAQQWDTANVEKALNCLIGVTLSMRCSTCS